MNLLPVLGLCLTILAVPLESLAQSQTITGKVTDDSGEGLPGVTVILKDSQGVGTTTDLNGTYRLAVPQGGGTLSFSFVGFLTEEREIGNRSVIDVQLNPDIKTLQEVEVVSDGYQTIKRTDLTGSVSSITAEELQRIPVASTAEAITGRLPGVRVMTTDGSPGADIIIRVRGGGSITQDNAPLYVVDGFIVGNIRDIPPTDILTMDVLKDAAATAIYGAQGANGVIVITTKQPKGGKTNISYNNFFQWKELPPNRMLQVLSPYEYVLANYEHARLRSQADVDRFSRFFGNYDDLELYQSRVGTNWMEEIFGDPIISQYHNLSINGGSEKTKLMLSLTHNNDQGLMINSGYQRTVGNFKMNHEISKSLKFDLGARITHSVTDGAGTSGSSQFRIKDALTTRPVNGIADELDINLNIVDSEDDFQSFLLSMIDPRELAEQDWRRRTEDSYVINSGLTWSIIDNLNFRTTFTIENDYDRRLRYYGPLTSESFNVGNNLPLGRISEGAGNSYRWVNTLSYNTDALGEQHDLNVLLGQEINSAGGRSSEVRARDFRLSMQPEEMFPNFGLGDTYYSTTYQNTRNNLASVFGKINYQFMDRYLLTATFRADQSSRFAAGNRTGFFPALAAGWKIHEEDFMDGADFVDELKLRLSYGEMGNNRIPSTATQFLFRADRNNGPGMGTNDYQSYYVPDVSSLPNPNLIWETTISRNAGLDFKLFNARLNGSLDAYYNTTVDLLFEQPISPVSGFNSQYMNIGSTSNRGIELGLNAYLLEDADYTLSASMNFGINRGRVEDLGGVEQSFFRSDWISTSLKDRDDYYLRVGGPIGQIYGFVNDGMYTVDDFQSYDEATGKYILKEGIPDNSNILGVSSVRPGYMKIRDITGDSLITSEDRMVIGNGLPKAQGGFGFNARWKGFDASVFFNWSYGNDIYNTGKIEFNQFYRQTFGNMLSTMHSDDRFTYIDIDGTYTGTPGAVVTDLEQLREMNQGKTMWSHTSFGQATGVLTDWAIEDGSFLRLNNLSIGYSLPQSLISKAKISQFRVYATGYNLWLWTKYTGFDPEVTTTRSSSYPALTPGVDYSAYPRARSLTVGVNVTF